jgi:hypothetical protein
VHRALLPVATDVGGIKIAQAIRTAFRARVGMFNLPGSASPKLAVVIERERTPTDVASPVRAIKDSFKTIV